MDIRQLTDDFAVSPQIDVAHMKEIAGAGFRSLLCNRPDGEEMGQTDFAAIEDAAAQEGLEIRWIPIVSGMVTQGAMSEFTAALDEMPKPILAYCRSGTRCTMLWSIAQYGRLDDQEIVSRAAKAGYDMGPLIQQLSNR
ncbi:TIGR01244 family sulfur transferase [Roseovarius rhodophyticola]|uniref:TIGR01244 family sulfur transferase n=1 Tax=Roseovarius rhodophyticola TaxID=3080827 RepID=A0ABZ2TI82_9RHOB|nr:TIGR01244 family sulfur transferase [Roseovarius sp. W115]MDV2929741.1 TIGR01244 family sulfur transferase [Roseovarius sp. W115]